MLFHSSHTQGDICLILDVGNASLAGSLVCLKKESLPEALATVRLPLHISMHAHPEKLQATLLSQLEEVLRILHDASVTQAHIFRGGVHITKVLCVCASPWYVSRTKHITITNEKPFFITKKFLDDVLQKEVTVFEEELSRGEHGEEFKSGVVVMEQTIADAKINGYTIDNPIGQKTNSCDMTLYLGVGSKELTERIAGKIHARFHIDSTDILWHSFPLVAHTTLYTVYPHEKDYLLCDITGEVTDITLVQNGVIGNTVSFPSGKFFLIRKIAHAMDVPTEVAESLLHMWQSGDADAQSAQHIEQSITDAEKEWAIYLEDALAAYGAIGALPYKIFLTADNDVAPLFINFLKIEKTDTTAVWRKNISVVYISKDILTPFYTSAPTLTFDDCVAIDSIFLSRF